MPLRTIMNYQYRYGGSTKHATKKLYQDGGLKRSVTVNFHNLLSYQTDFMASYRYYNGLLPALIQGPIARFGDTAANVGILALLSSNP